MNIDELTIQAAEIPAGRSLSAAELDQAERALARLLRSYREQQLKGDLRQLLQAQAERHTQAVDGAAEVGYIILNNELMQPAELYRLIDAAEALGRYLDGRIYRRLEQKAAEGDPEATEEIKLLK